MAHPRPVDYLQDDEPVTAQVRRHTLSAVDGYIGIVAAWVFIAGASAAVAWAGPPSWALSAWTIAGMATVGAFWLALLLHWRRATSLYTVTPERVYMAYGRLRFHLLQTTHDKITDMHVHQSIFGRFWGYGTVRVQTAGTGLALAGVLNPLDFKRDIEEARRTFIGQLAGEMSEDSRHEVAPRNAPETQWTGRPSGGSLLGGLLGAMVAFLVAGGLLVSAIVFGNSTWVGAAVAGSVGLIVAWSQWVVFRYTQYEVSDRGVVVTRGWLTRRRVEATFAKVTDVSVVQDVLGRILGYGRISINTAGGNEAPVVFMGVANPDAVKEIIDEARGA